MAFSSFSPLNFFGSDTEMDASYLSRGGAEEPLDHDGLD